MTPPLLKKINFLNTPIWAEKLGKNKTWRGLVGGTIVAIIAVMIQKAIQPPFAPYDYYWVSPLVLGFCMGAGALIGDAIESFFKRKVGVKPGQPWIPFDQIDWIVGAVLLTNIYMNIGMEKSLIAILIFGILHPVANLIGYFLKIREVPL